MKGTVIFHLLTILREETDAQHRLSQQALVDRLQERFGDQMNRRTLKTYLDHLIAAGYPLNAEKRIRVHPNGTEDTVLTDWYLEPQFEMSELRLLIDLLQAMPAVPENQREQLMQKLLRLAPPSFRKSTAQQIIYLHTPPAQQLMFSVEILCEAIRKDCMVSFCYGSYRLDPSGRPALLPRRNDDNTVREYLVSPYEIAVSHGRYYLICCKEPYRTLSNYRIDRITEMRLLEPFSRVPLAEITDAKPYSQKLAEQLYMYSGEAVTVQFHADAAILGDVLDWFGTDIAISPTEHIHTLRITVNVHPTAMKHWALQYGQYVTVISPPALRDEIASSASAIALRYSNE